MFVVLAVVAFTLVQTPAVEEATLCRVQVTIEEQLECVTRAVNKHIEWVSDQDIYGVEDRWMVNPQQFGDCEDFALTKMIILHQVLGIPKERIRIAVVTLPYQNIDAVVLVDNQYVLTYDSPWVLNITDFPEPDRIYAYDLAMARGTLHF